MKLHQYPVCSVLVTRGGLVLHRLVEIVVRGSIWIPFFNCSYIIVDRVICTPHPQLQRLRMQAI